jgi:hypothetical protein
MEKYLIDTDFISNISDSANRDVKIEDLLKEFSKTKIVHRKDLYLSEN